MDYSLLIESEGKGPLKVLGTAKVSNPDDPQITGWYYPVYLTIDEAIRADRANGGRGIFRTLTFYEYRGEFYIADSLNYLGMPNEPVDFTNYKGEGAINPFAKIKYSLSELVPDQLPGFVLNEYDKFVVFLKAYYEFLEQNNKAQEVLENLSLYSDIDETAEELVENFFKTYAYDISFSEISDNKTFLKRIRELYSKKGTETSYRILFSYLFKETIEFFYPYTVVLKASDGKWKTRISLKVKQINAQQNIYDFKDTIIRGRRSGATASVKNVLFFQVGAFEYFELELEEKSLIGNFLAEETIITESTPATNLRASNTALEAELYSVISRIQIVDSGIGYEAGKEISIIDSSGQYGKAEILGVDLLGGIKSIQILDSGFDYSPSTIVDPGLPTKVLEGQYSVTRGRVTVRFPNRHGIKLNTNIEVEYTGNVFSPIDGEVHNAVVVSIPDPRSIRYRYPGF